MVCVRSVDAHGGYQDAVSEKTLSQDGGRAREHLVVVPCLVHFSPMVCTRACAHELRGWAVLETAEPRLAGAPVSAR